MKTLSSLALAPTLSLILVSSARAADVADTAPTPPAVLYFVNGDHLPGTPLDGDQTNAFLWQATDFTRPFRFDGDSISEIRFGAPSAAAAVAGEFCFDLSGGDVLHGDLIAIGDDELVVDSSRAGRLWLKRAGALRMSRCRGNPALKYQGPTGLDGWGPPEAAAAWSDDGGHLATDRESAVLTNDLALPPQTLIELAISWKAQPDFALVLGAGAGDADARRAFRFEVLDGELIVRRETERDFDIDSIMPLARGEGRVHLLAILDQEQERLLVLSPEGKRLAAIRALDDAPRVRSGVRLEHQQGGLRLELLRISRYAGRPPPEVNLDAPRVHLTDGTVVYGNVTRYDAAERQFIVQTGAGERTIAVDQIENVFLMGAKQKRSIEVAALPPARPPLFMATARVVCVDGTRLSGQFAGIAEGCLRLNSPAMAEPVALRVDGLRELRFTYPGARVRETPLPFPLLQADGLKLHGKIVPGKAQAGESCLAWQPSGSSTSSPLRAGVSGRIGFSGRIAGPLPAQGAVPGAAPGGMGPGGMAVRQRRVVRQGVPQPAAGAAVPQGAVQAAAQADGAQRRPRRGGDEERDTLFLRTGDALPCRVLAIDDRGVSLKSPFSDAIVAPHEWVRAIEFGPEASPPQLDPDKLQRLLTLPRAQKHDPPTHVIGATTGDYLRGKLRSMDERTLRFEIHGKERELARDRIARLVWLQNGEDDEAGEPPPGCVQAVRLDGVRLTFKAEEVTDEWIAGEGDLLGPCRARFDQLRELLFGNRVRRAALKLEYSWKLVDAQTPLAFRNDPAAGGTAQPGADSPLVGQAAIDFELPLLDGSKFRLSQSRGKIVVLDFWASWCGPCMQGLPKVASVAGGYPEAEVKLVAVNLQETSAEAVDALRRLKLDIAVALDRDGKVANEYGATNIPYTLIIGADGKVARVFVGTGPQLERQLAEALAQIRKAAN